MATISKPIYKSSKIFTLNSPIQNQLYLLSDVKETKQPARFWENSSQCITDGIIIIWHPSNGRASTTKSIATKYFFQKKEPYNDKQTVKVSLDRNELDGSA